MSFHFMQIETGVFFCRSKFLGQAVRSEEPIAERRIRAIGDRSPVSVELRAEKTILDQWISTKLHQPDVGDILAATALRSAPSGSTA